MKISSLIAPLAIWIVTLAIPLTMLFRPAANAWAVLKNPVSTAGVVTELRRDDHRTVVAQYEVRGAAYYSSTSLSENVGIPAFDRLQLGEKVPIVYRAGHPESGVIGNPKMLLESLAEDFVFISAFLLIFSIMLYGRIRVWLCGWLPVPSHR